MVIHDSDLIYKFKISSNISDISDTISDITDLDFSKNNIITPTSIDYINKELNTDNGESLINSFLYNSIDSNNIELEKIKTFKPDNYLHDKLDNYSHDKLDNYLHDKPDNYSHDRPNNYSHDRPNNYSHDRTDNYSDNTTNNK